MKSDKEKVNAKGGYANFISYTGHTFTSLRSATYADALSILAAVTTSLSCDGNLNTFRYLEKKKGVPFTFLDVPYRDDEASVEYLAEQLKEFAAELERRFGKTFDEEKLRQAIRIENETRR